MGKNKFDFLGVFRQKNLFENFGDFVRLIFNILKNFPLWGPVGGSL